MYKKILTFLICLIITFIFIPPQIYADSWKVIINDIKDSKLEADIESISFKEEKEFLSIKLKSFTNWNLNAQESSVFIYFDIYGSKEVKASNGVLVITEYEFNKYAVGFLDMITGITTQCENDFKHFNDIGIIDIPREAYLNKFYKFSFLCVLGSSFYGDFKVYDVCPDNGSMKSYISSFCPNKPILNISKSVINFGSARKNVKLNKEFQVFNGGNSKLDVSFENIPKHINFTPNKLLLDEFRIKTIKIEINLSELDPGAYENKIIIKSNGGNENLLLLYEELKEPILDFDIKSIDFGTLAIGEKSVQTLKIFNAVKGPIKARISCNVDWLAISKTSFENESEEIKLTVSTKKLTTGEYSGILKISSDGGDAEIPLFLNIVHLVSIDKSEIDFGKVISNNLYVDYQTLAIKSNFKDLINIQIQTDVSWIAINEINIELLPFQQEQIELNVDLNKIGKQFNLHTGHLTIISSEYDLKIDIVIKIEIVEADPMLDFRIDGDLKSLDQELISGDKQERTIMIKNIGGGILRVKVFIEEENNIFKLNKTNIILRSGESSELIINIDLTNTAEGIFNNKIILETNYGISEIPIKIKVNPKIQIIITLTIGRKEAYCNDKLILMDSQPYIKKGTTFVPLRFISEIFGAKVEWENIGKGRIYIYLNDKKIILDISSDVAFINKNSYILSAPPEVINNRTFVPVRFISEGLGAKVEWDSVKQEITIKYNPV